jgi:NodT family efflux transporter outer membrane factor (OMF) lipoprotein
MSRPTMRPLLGPSMVAALLLTGCMVGPDYHKADAPIPTTYKELKGWQVAQPLDAIDRGAWWSIYHDPVLDGLERQIDVSNQTLQEAEAAYRNARAIVDEARANLFPTLGVTAGDTRSSRGGGSINSSGLTSSTSTSGRTTSDYELEGTASWDLDVWGRIRRQVESNVAAAQVSAADVDSARLSAQGQLASDYFQLRGQDSLQQLLDATVAADQRALQITQNQYGVGVAARSDVVTAQALLQSVQAQAVAVAELRGQLEHAIAVLTGRPPAELTIAAAPLTDQAPVMPPGVPSTLLQRRPDVAAAERSMQEENALVGVAVAAYYPDISLSAFYGYSGNPIGSLIETANRVWSLGASATESLFEGGARSSAVRAARATYDESVATYRQTVLTAFQQVEDELVALRVLEQQAKVQDQAVQSVRLAVVISLNQYRAGTVPYTTVITEQTQQLTDEQTALTIRQNRMVASVALIQALGGGWDTTQLPSRNSLQQNNPLLP